jgi:SagB-type dehydrogenase family enzyme
MPGRVVIASILVLSIPACAAAPSTAEPVDLTLPSQDGGFADLLRSRISTRTYSVEPLTLALVGDLLWAACGELPDGRRTVPSAGALYPLVLYLVAGDVEGLESGVYRYSVEDHTLEPVSGGDTRAALCEACLGQPWVAAAPASLVICADPAVTVSRYGERGEMYVLIEVGHCGQNVYLACAAWGLGTVAVGAFEEAAVSAVLGLTGGVRPFYVMPVGVPAVRAAPD